MAETKATHTPTPWRDNGWAEPSGRVLARAIWTDPSEKYICGSVSNIGNGSCEPSQEEQDANMRYIVRACNCHDELLAAATELLACCDSLMDFATGDDEAAAETMRAALAKATEGQQ